MLLFQNTNLPSHTFLISHNTHPTMILYQCLLVIFYKILKNNAMLKVHHLPINYMILFTLANNDPNLARILGSLGTLFNNSRYHFIAYFEFPVISYNAAI